MIESKPKDKYEMYCGNCSNLMRIELLDKRVFCCGGNVDNPKECGLRKKHYQIKVKDSVYKIPKENITLLALQKAMDMSITHGNIHDEKTAIDFLTNLGMEISEVY